MQPMPFCVKMKYLNTPPLHHRKENVSVHQNVSVQNVSVHQNSDVIAKPAGEGFHQTLFSKTLRKTENSMPKKLIIICFHRQPKKRSTHKIVSVPKHSLLANNTHTKYACEKTEPLSIRLDNRKKHNSTETPDTTFW